MSREKDGSKKAHHGITDIAPHPTPRSLRADEILDGLTRKESWNSWRPREPGWIEPQPRWSGEEMDGGNTAVGDEKDPEHGRTAEAK